MKLLFNVRVEIRRLFLTKSTWFIILCTVLCPLAGYRFYQPTNIATISGFALANPVLAGGIGGGILFALLTLFECNWVYKNQADALMESIVSPLRLGVVKLVAIMAVALAAIVITSVVYFPYTFYRMEAVFDFMEYVKCYFILMLPSLWLAVLASSMFYQLFRRVDLSFVLFVVFTFFSLGKWASDEYLLRWINPLVPNFSSDFSNGVVFRTAGYNRLFWFALLLGLWLFSLLGVRIHRKGFLGSFLHNVRKFYILIASLVLLSTGGYLYVSEPYIDHSPTRLAGSGNGGQTMVTTTPSSPYAEENSELILLNTKLKTDINASNSSLSSTVIYQLKNSSGQPQECVLQLNPGYSIDGIKVNGSEINYRDKKNDHDRMKDVVLQTPADAEIKLEVSYSGSPKIWSELRSQLSGSSIEGDYIDLGGTDLRPRINAVADGAGLIGEITLPESLELISTGKPAQVLHENKDETKTWQFESQSGGVQIFAGNYKRMELQGTSMPIYFYYSQKHQRQMEALNIKAFLEETLKYCINQYGPLPYTKEEPLSIVVSATHRFGGGLTGNISIMNESRFGEAGLALSRRGEINAEVISAGIIQQWWGQGAQLMDAKNPYWTTEGVTTYTSYRMMEEKNGEKYARKNHVDVWKKAWTDLSRNFYSRNPEYQNILPEKYISEMQDQFASINTTAVMALKIYKAAQRIGEEKMDTILADLYRNGGTEFPPFITWQDFLSACGVTEEELSLDENI
ncbi:hypothetical protein [Paenibacillus graminis]|uniref:hypothetical protein n=1 Tax=Paenibacillus graminis TaxID=189425 RepID=UPI002DBB5500|nr:hypothetical protein [Paenibacillus graminis]MEC0168823.1 hypothetical protein [Paenibacillus graminis]